MARLGGRKFAAIVRKVGFAPRFSEFKIQNMVATADAGFAIRLEALVYAHAKYSSTRVPPPDSRDFALSASHTRA